MKIVRNYINEKFTEDSDPVGDLEIGISNLLKDLPKKIKDTDILLIKQNEFEYSGESEDPYEVWRPVTEEKREGGILRKLRIDKNYVFFGHYRNRFRNKNTKKVVDKVEYSKQILEILKISECFEELPVVKSYREGFDKYNCTEITFIIKPKYGKYFKISDKPLESI